MVVRRSNCIWLALAVVACGVDERTPQVQEPLTVVEGPGPEGMANGGASGSSGQSLPNMPDMPIVPGMQMGSGGTGGMGGTSEQPLNPQPLNPQQPAPDPAQPGPGPAPPLVDCTGESAGFDTLLQVIAADLLLQDRDDRLSIRYISLGNQVGPGDCPERLAEERSALAKGLNMLSLNPTIRTPVAVDAAQTLYRVDLRDFNWDRPIQLNGTSFADAWEAIAANNPFAVPFVGPDADDANAASNTAQPFMFSDQLLHTALAGALYYALIGVDVNAPLSDLILGDLGVNLAGNLQNGVSARAWTTRSSIAGQQSHLVQRDALEVRAGFLWQNFELAISTDTFLTRDLLAMPAADGEAIFTLPNGMLAFLLFNSSGAVVDRSAFLIDNNRNDLQVITSVSCSNCHGGGLLPLVDEAQAAALANAASLGLDREQTLAIQTLYPSQNEFARVVDTDTQAYLADLGRTGAPLTGPDPVARSFFRFDDDLQLADAAGDLGLTPSDLKNNLNLLDPALGSLATGTLDRDDFASSFANSLCELAIANQNQPDPNFCDAASN